MDSRILLWLALGVGGLGCLFSLLLAARIGQLRRRLVLLQGGARGEDILGILAIQRDDLERWRRAQSEEVRRLEERLASLRARVEELAGALQGAVQRVGVVRYDAFPDMGGKLSFSAAFLNARGDGVVLSSISGRQETRTYAKPVKGGRSPHNLSEEEEEAIRVAMEGGE